VKRRLPQYISVHIVQVLSSVGPKGAPYKEAVVA